MKKMVNFRKYFIIKHKLSHQIIYVLIVRGYLRTINLTAAVIISPRNTVKMLLLLSSAKNVPISTNLVCEITKMKAIAYLRQPKIVRA